MPAHPALDPARWADAMTRRSSVRVFTGVHPPEAELSLVGTAAEQFVPFDDARTVVLRDAPPEIFRGVVGSYGRVTGSPCALVFIATPESPTAEEHCGYTGEGVVLEANAIGLSTCWITGSFRRHIAEQVVRLKPGEVVRGVSPLGYAARPTTVTGRRPFGAGEKRRRPLDQIAPGHEGWPAWALEGLKAARVAPSALNGQPWRFRMEGDAVVVGARLSARAIGTARLDCGIAMLHFELGARSEGCDGSWEPMSGADVARWVPLS